MTATAGRRSPFDRDPTAADQVGAARALVVIVERAAKDKLLPVVWDLGDLGLSLVARAAGYASDDAAPDYPATAALRRQAFDQYLGLLRTLQAESVARFGPTRSGRFVTELAVHPERRDSFAGVVRLMAVLKNVTIPIGGKREKFLHTLVVTADIQTDPDSVETR